MQWFQALRQKLPQHKYAIHAALLGDDTQCAWTNLGLWNSPDYSYPQAAMALAQQLAESIHLNSKDKLLDLGCGQGASLKLWKTQFNLQHIEAVDIQSQCVDNIIHTLPFVQHAHCGSFLNLKKTNFEFKFDVVLCIDAAYHSDLNSFLTSVKSVLNSKARIAFHYLALTERYKDLNSFERLKLKTLLKSADIDLQDLNSNTETSRIIEYHGFQDVQIVNLSEPVLHGFAQYIQHSKKHRLGQWSVDRLKIQMTAQLCEKLYMAGLVNYVQICARYKD